MATKINVNGKLVTRPGVYTLVKSAIQNAPVALAYGNVAIIDDSIGAGWGGGKGKEAYTFNTVQDLQNFVKGGPIFDLAAPLFNPLPNKRLQGASSVTLIQARDTTPATIVFTLTNGTLTLTTKDEGLNANGVSALSDLRQGYAGKLIAGKTTDRYIFQLWHGSYKGLDPLNNTPYDGVSQGNAAPIKITESPEVADLNALNAWLATDFNTQAGFTVSLGAVTNGGDLTPADISGTYVLASGATETYSAAAFTAAVAKALSADVNIFLSMQSNANAQHANNSTILSDVILAGKYERHLVIAGGSTLAELDTVSIVAATYFNSDKVILVHGDGLNTIRGGSKKRSSLWKAANIVGRCAGLEPQTPLTLKSIGIDSEANPVDEASQEKALSKGVLVTYKDDELGYEVVLQGINTLQTNDYLVNDDGTSHSWAVRRIVAQLNKEAAIYIKRKFFGKDTVGPNRNTVTEQDLVAAMEGFLHSKTASSLQDNLIVAYGNISATVDSDTYRVNYNFVPNFEVNKIVITGFIHESL